MKTKIFYTLFFFLIITNCSDDEEQTTTFLPEVTTQEATNLTENSVTIKGAITDSGSSEISQKGITWSTTSVDPDLNDSKTTHGAGSDAFSSNMENLQMGTTYYARAYATNEIGTNYGKTILFTTHSGTIELVTLNATEITEVTAKIAATITNKGSSEITEKGICWATTSLEPTTANNTTTEGAGNGNFTSDLVNLKAGTTYYARTYVTTADGTNYGNTILFQTTLPLPTVTTKEATNTTQYTVQTGGIVEFPSNLLITQRGVCWSLTTEPTLEDNFSSDGTGNGQFTSTLNELTPNTTYYIRAYAINSDDKIAYGDEISFKTKAIAATLTTNSISEITQTTAKSGGNITDDGGDTIVTRGVCWSTNEQPTIEDDKTVDGTGAESFNSEITNLTPNTNYYVRSYATNSEGTTAYGDEQTLTTLPANIIYPENGFYGTNLLDPSVTEVEARGQFGIDPDSKGRYSFAVNLPKGTNLKIVLTSLQFVSSTDNFSNVWTFSSTSIRNWYITNYNEDLGKQTFEVVFDDAGSNLRISMPRTPTTFRMDYYENGSETPTRTKVIKVNE